MKTSTTYSWPNGNPIPSIPPQDVKNLDGSIPGPYPDDGDEGGGHQEPMRDAKNIDSAGRVAKGNPNIL